MNRLWYALHVRNRFEKVVEGQLARNGFETFLPTYVRTQRWAGHLKQLSIPLFPAYLFAQFDFSQTLRILEMPGVKSIAGAAKTALPCNEEEIAAVRRVVESSSSAFPWPYVTTGENVRVASGPLEGIRGLLISDKGSDRLIVSIAVVMRSVAVEIDREYTRPLRKETEATHLIQTVGLSDSHRVTLSRRIS